VATTVGRDRPAAQPCKQEGLPGHQFISAGGHQIRLALLAHLQTGDQLGGAVCKGEHGEIVVFWKIEDTDQTDSDAVQSEGDERARRRFLLRFYRVWNVEQCAFPQAVLDKLGTIETHQHDPIEAAEQIIAGMPHRPEIRYEGSQAFYSPLTDRVTLPSRTRFATVADFYAVLDHELAHASGHRTRLNRESITEAAPFGSPVYGREELLAGNVRGLSMCQGGHLAHGSRQSGGLPSRLAQQIAK
jgi:antirestriction protein ArdC